MRHHFVLLALITAAAVSRASAENPNYRVTDLGTLGGTASWATAINNSGQIVGRAYTAGNASFRAFRYDGSQMHDIGTLGGSNSYATAINDAGHIVGASDVPYITPTSNADWDATGAKAFFYNGSTMSPVGTLGGPYSTARAVNNSDQVAGYSDAIVGPYVMRHGFLKTGSQLVDVGTFGPGDNNVFAMNNAGQVVGRAFNGVSSTDYFFAYRYSNGSLQNLGTLGGNHSIALDINNAGVVVGGAATATADSHAFIYAGSMTDLGTLGGTSSWAYAINDNGVAVGVSDLAGNVGRHPFIYSNGTMTDLTTLIPANSGWAFEYVTDININGWIIGYGINPEGQTHGFLLTPVPEPISFYLLALGGFAAAKRRRSH